MPIFQKYADYYDILYQDKNYKSECRFLEKVFKKYSEKPIKTILDLGCGTGNHDIVLAKKGYRITGVDLSTKMLGVARKKDEENKLKIDFIQRNLQNINLYKKFDAIISMFSTIGYQTTNRELELTFENVSKHLKQKGLFIFDCWFGPAVFHILPSEKFKIIKKRNQKLLKFSTPILDIIKQTIDIHYKVIKMAGGRVLDEFDEVHKIRFFFPQEISHFLEKKKMNILEISPFLKMSKTPSLNDWNVIVIAKKYD